MTEPSPAAQAVLDAFYKGEGNRPIDYLDRFACYDERIAAVLRAAADQVVPEEPLYGGDQRWMFERDARQECRKKLLAIAEVLAAMRPTNTQENN